MRNNFVNWSILNEMALELKIKKIVEVEPF